MASRIEDGPWPVMIRSPFSGALWWNATPAKNGASYESLVSSGLSLDNCIIHIPPPLSNEPGHDYDGDGIGDECDSDVDNDGVPGTNDLCPKTPIGEAVDANGCSGSEVDADGDGVCDPFALGRGPSNCTGTDNCPKVPNPDQRDTDADGIDGTFLQRGSPTPTSLASVARSLSDGAHEN